MAGTGFPRTGFPFVFQSAAFALLAWAAAGVRWFRNCVFAPLALLMALYFPVGFNYGLANEGQIASLFATDALEAAEFLGTLAWWQCAAPFLLAAGLWLFYRVIGRRGLFPKGKAAWALLIAALALTAASGDFRPAHRTGRFLKQAWTETRSLAKIDIGSDWKDVKAQPRHRICLLVIGESERRDYLHAYGYPVPNTPFMDSVPGVIYEGFTSEGDNTLPSLKKALTWTVPSGKPFEPRLNLIDLARDAGYSTAWFSNQGYATRFDTPVTAVAARAERSVWLKLGMTAANNYYDDELLPLVEKEIARPDSRPKLIVAHLLGSHTNPCERVRDKGRLLVPEGAELGEIACYGETVRQTDEWLRRARDLLAASGESWSVLYFSDHGLSHTEFKGRPVLRHGPVGGLQREVPLFAFSSDDTEQRRVKGLRYGRRFTEGVAAWLGIRSEQLPAPRSLFDAVPDEPDAALEAELKARRQDRAIDLTAAAGS